MKSSPTCPARTCREHPGRRGPEHHRRPDRRRPGQDRSDARRTIEQGGAYVNNRRIETIDVQLSPEHLASESVMVLRSGKKKYALLRFAS